MFNITFFPYNSQDFHLGMPNVSYMDVHVSLILTRPLKAWLGHLTLNKLTDVEGNNKRR